MAWGGRLSARRRTKPKSRNGNRKIYFPVEPIQLSSRIPVGDRSISIRWSCQGLQPLQLERLLRLNETFCVSALEVAAVRLCLFQDAFHGQIQLALEILIQLPVSCR